MEIFAICELGERVSIAFEKIHFEINMLRWYLLPTTARRVLPTILIATQEPMAFDIFGSTACNRITFKGVSSMFQLQTVCIYIQPKKTLKIYTGFKWSPINWTISLPFRFATKCILRLWCSANLIIKFIMFQKQCILRPIWATKWT